MIIEYHVFVVYVLMTLYVKQGFIFRNDAYKNFSAGVWSNVDVRWKPKSESTTKTKINFFVHTH